MVRVLGTEGGGRRGRGGWWRDGLGRGESGGLRRWSGKRR